MDNCIEIEDYVDIVQYNLSDEAEDTEIITPQIIIDDENAVEVKICQDTDEFMLLEVTIVEGDDGHDHHRNETTEKLRGTDIVGYVTEYMTHENMMAYREEKKKDPGYAEAKYKCESCIMRFYSQCGLDNHNQFVHLAKEGTKQCKVCQSYVVSDSFNTHLYNHYIKNVCKTCGHAEDHTHWARKHVRSHYESDISDNKKILGGRKGDQRILPVPGTSKYQCTECDNEYVSMTQAKRHYRYQHVEKALRTCKKCKTQCSTEATFARHILLCYAAKEVHTCEQCNEEFPSIKVLNKHQMIHTHPYHCLFCSARFKRKRNLYAHSKRVHDRLTPNKGEYNDTEEMIYE